eukprot:CAMPEP_0177786154 /NCGR_PEP_ID=MMETSP0491_2-20121128/20764_1 /TAXON_ID=63592 /ORGANISM="Tetraselmis chuii, Strain PLY429" /LENGTH=349 /DNA_ID=CAMNT_0019307331 /DNA_START=205 /DNA_END=1252 /DNA_ORIENTATION=-
MTGTIRAGADLVSNLSVRPSAFPTRHPSSSEANIYSPSLAPSPVWLWRRLVHLTHDLLVEFADFVTDKVAFAEQQRNGVTYLDWCPDWSVSTLPTARELYGRGLDAHKILLFLFEMPFALELEEPPLHWLPPLLETWFVSETDVDLDTEMSNGTRVLDMIIMDPRLDVKMLECWVAKSAHSSSQCGNRAIQLLVNRVARGFAAADHEGVSSGEAQGEVTEEERYWRITASLQAFQLMLAYGCSPFFARALLAEEIWQQQRSQQRTAPENRAQGKGYTKEERQIIGDSSGGGLVPTASPAGEANAEVVSALTTMHAISDREASRQQHHQHGISSWREWLSALWELLSADW